MDRPQLLLSRDEAVARELSKKTHSSEVIYKIFLEAPI